MYYFNWYSSESPSNRNDTVNVDDQSKEPSGRIKCFSNSKNVIFWLQLVLMKETRS